MNSGELAKNDLKDMRFKFAANLWTPWIRAILDFRSIRVKKKMQIHSKSDKFPVDHIKLQIEDPDLDIARAKDLAKAKARQLNKDAMLLSWYCGKTGEFYPKFECGYTHKPPWIIFAEARGGNLTIDINDGEYVFIYLKL